MPGQCLGIRVAEVSATIEHTLGQRHETPDGKVYTYVQANGAIVATDVVIVDEAGQADQIDLTNSATARGDKVAIANIAFADNDYGWVQRYGPSIANVATSAAANVVLNSTAVSGRLDDDSGAGLEDIEGLFLTAAEASNAAACMLNYPIVGVTG